MKRYRLIEYEIPNDYTTKQMDWLERTFANSIIGRYELPIGCAITAAEVDLDYQLNDTMAVDDWDAFERMRSKPWGPPHKETASLREFSRSGTKLP